jgi:hypothetical protein
MGNGILNYKYNTTISNINSRIVWRIRSVHRVLIEAIDFLFWVYVLGGASDVSRWYSKAGGLRVS